VLEILINAPCNWNTPLIPNCLVSSSSSIFCLSNADARLHRTPPVQYINNCFPRSISFVSFLSSHTGIQCFSSSLDQSSTLHPWGDQNDQSLPHNDSVRQ
jgi:hypothetical protein